MAQKPTQNRPQRPSNQASGRVNRDTIVRTRTLVAKGRKSTADEIRQKAREAERIEKERREQEQKKALAARKKKYEKQQRRRELVMFFIVLLVVGGIFLADTLIKKNDAHQAEHEPEVTVQEAQPLADTVEEPEPETVLQTEEPEPEEMPEEPVTEESEEEPEDTEEAAEEEAPTEEELFPDVLAEFQSEGRGSDNRVNNLTKACEAIHGYILQPGEQFSFNEVLGERTEARGYLPASIYTAGDDNLAYGGGICQVASTLYYCALKSDLKIDERLAHFYTVDYVPYGLDATIDWGNIDLKFTNNTEHPIQLRAEVTYLGVFVRILGTDTDDTYIELSSDIINTYYYETIKQINYNRDIGYTNWLTLPKNGYDVISYQDVYSADGELIERREITKSYYQKIDLILEVGPYT
ncbi:MAG: VanW family protein [Oscillospiraceae bacterium]|nr:VanW family protein [Oscillospiraceae bacterium]